MLQDCLCLGRGVVPNMEHRLNTFLVFSKKLAGDEGSVPV